MAYPLRLIKQFFEILRKEYHITVTKRTTAKDVGKALRRKQEVTRTLAEQQRKSYGLIKLWKYSPQFKNKVLSQRGHIVYSKSKTGRTYIRLSIPWTEPQKQFIRERSRYSTDTLYQSFTQHFGDIRSKQSVEVMKSRLKHKGG